MDRAFAPCKPAAIAEPHSGRDGLLRTAPGAKRVRRAARAIASVLLPSVLGEAWSRRMGPGQRAALHGAARAAPYGIRFLLHSARLAGAGFRDSGPVHPGRCAAAGNR